MLNCRVIYNIPSTVRSGIDIRIVLKYSRIVIYIVRLYNLCGVILYI
jgi:hypothetical protein